MGDPYYEMNMDALADAISAGIDAYLSEFVASQYEIIKDDLANNIFSRQNLIIMGAFFVLLIFLSICTANLVTYFLIKVFCCPSSLHYGCTLKGTKKKTPPPPSHQTRRQYSSRPGRALSLRDDDDEDDRRQTASLLDIL